MAKAISKKVWRYQCDPFVNSDPMVEVFMEETTAVEDQEFKRQKTTPLSVRMLDLFGPLDLIDPERVERLAGTPASDRIVPLNHNQPEYIKAVESVDKLEKAITVSNELTEAEREAAGTEISALKRILSGSYVYGRRLFVWGTAILTTIAATIEHDFISALASDAAHWIIELAKTLI
jgi:hypothetical protein